MPAIEHLRIVGVRYNQQQKMYKDRTFDLRSSHALMSMINTGGKGVALQCTFQVVLPLVSWGKEGKNHVRHFFYDDKGRFKPYTFHVVLEWTLDTFPRRHLLAGIAITARLGQKKDNTVEQEDPVEIDYVTYTKEYAEHELYSIYSLPLFDDEKQNVLPFKDWEKMLEELEKTDDFKMFSNSSKDKKKYKDTLASYGIHEDDWNEMVKMNRNEAGIQDYFERIHPNSRTNTGLFKDMIIPTIAEQVLQETAGQGGLAKLFKDAAVIAERLPLLRSREDAYRMLMEWTDLLEQDLLQYKTAQSDLKGTERYGQQLRHCVEALLDQTQKDHEYWTAEQIRVSEWKKDLDWQVSNLEYVRTLRDERKKEHTLQEVVKAHEDAFVKVREREAEVFQAKRNVLRRIRDDFLSELVRLDKEIKAIEQSTEYRGNQQKLEELTRKVENNWSAVHNEMLLVMNAYTQYQKYLDQEAEVGRSKSRQAQQELVNAFIEVRRTRDWLDRFEARTNKMVDQYGHGIRFDPVPLVEQAQVEQGKIKQQQIQWEGKAKSLDQQHRTLENGETKLKAELSRVTQDAHQRYTQYEEQLQAEQNLAAQVCLLLRVDREEHMPLPEFLLSRRSVLEERQDYWHKRITELRKQQWDIEQVLSVEAELGGSDTWIPNKTMAKTKSKLESKGFRVVSGTEYLQDKNESQRESLLQSFPLLPYSLIVMQSDIGSICSSNLFVDDIHTSPVPLYAAELLGEQEHHLFQIASNRAYQLAGDPEAWKRKKEQLESERKLLIEQIGKSVDFEEEHREVVQSIQNVLYTTTSVRLFADFERLDLTQKEIDFQLQNIQNEIQACQEELKECLETIDATRQTLDQQTQSLQELIDYAELFLEQDQWRHDHYSAEKKVKELEAKDKQGDEQLKRANLLSREWESAYWEWDTKMNRILEKVQIFIPSALLPRPTASAISSVEPVLQCNTSLLEEDIAVLKSLMDEIDQNHMQLGILRSKRVENINKRQAAQKNLVDFDPSWEDHLSPTSSQNVLERKVSDCEMELTKAQTLEREQDMAKTRAETDSEHARNLRIRQERRVKSPNPWEEEQDLNKKEREIHLNFESQKRQSDDILAQLNAADGLTRELEKVSGSLRMVDTDGSSLPFDTVLKESLRNRAREVVEEWINQRKVKVTKADEAQRRAQATLKLYKGKTEQSTWDEVLKQAVLSEFRSCEATRDKVEESLEVVVALRDYVQFELEKQQEERNLSEKVRSDWSKHAARFCIQVIGNIKTMTQRMTIKSNRGGFKYELVRLKRAERLPQAIEDIETPIQEFFDKTLIDLLAVHGSMELVDLKAVTKRVNASDMIYAALNYAYPILEMYNLNTDNTFLTEPMRHNDFDTWETINNGSFTKTAGSGGQLVAARTLIAMMLMTFKRQSSDKHRSVLISDNPFANAISPHVIDPIFAIADVLQFQWVVFTPTELVKLEISQKFPVYCALELEKQASGKDVVMHHVHHGFRQIEQAPRLI